MTCGKLFHAEVDGEQRVVYRSMYDLPKGEPAMTRMRIHPGGALIPKESDVKLGEAVDTLSRIIPR